MTVARIRYFEQTSGLKVTGSDTAVESEDPAVVEPMLAELLSKLNTRQGKQFSVNGELASAVARASAAKYLTICLMVDRSRLSPASQTPYGIAPAWTMEQVERTAAR